MRIKTLIVAAAVAALAPASASTASSDYLVQVSIRAGGEPLASPSLVVAGGSTAAFMLGRSHRWIKVSATPVSRDRVLVALDSVTATSHGLSHGGGNAVVAADGGTARLSASSAGPGGGGVEVDVKVRPRS